MLIVLVLVGLLSAQPAIVTSGSATLHASAPTHQSVSPASAAYAGPARAVHPSDGNLTFPRTVLVETFTGVWCIHCPAETQALYDIDLNESHSYLATAELHVCAFAAGQGPCLDNYVPTDNTSYLREAFYNTCGGVPDVFFDGQHDDCGASTSMTGMRNEYLDQIHNASLIPGNVSITQTGAEIVASETPNFTTNVTDHISILSGLTGTYNLEVYLMEYIGKRNETVGYGNHDVGNVVRQTLLNHAESLTSGSTAQVSITAALNSSWNDRNFSIIAFVQDNSTKYVENANYQSVTTLIAGVKAADTNLYSASKTAVTVTVTNTTTGDAVPGATVLVSSSVGGTFAPAMGMTSMAGTFTTNYTAPMATTTENAVLTANVSAANYTSYGSWTNVTINPFIPPTVPGNFTIAPGVGQVELSWSPPSTGASGVTYYLYLGDASSGPYTEVTTTTQLAWTVPGLTAGQTFWFQVQAKDTGGFSPNSTAASAAPLTVTPTGLPTSVGWWIAFAGQNLTSPLGVPMVVFSPAGVYSYNYGSASYGFVQSQPPLNAIEMSSAAQTLAISFSPRLATLTGTVTPAGADVVANGTPLTVSSGGTFSWVTAPGTYTLVTSEAGYTTNTTTVTLTPGNVTEKNVVLVVATGSSGSTTTGSGISGSETVEIVAVAAVIVVAAVLGVAMLMSRRRSGGQNGGSP